MMMMILMIFFVVVVVSFEGMMMVTMMLMLILIIVTMMETTISRGMDWVIDMSYFPFVERRWRKHGDDRNRCLLLRGWVYV